MKRITLVMIFLVLISAVGKVYASHNRGNSRAQLQISITPTPTDRVTPTPSPSTTVTPSATPTPTRNPDRDEENRRGRNRGGPQEPTATPTPSPTPVVIAQAPPSEPPPQVVDDVVSAIVAPIGKIFNPGGKEFYKGEKFSTDLSTTLIFLAFASYLAGIILLYPYLWPKKAPEATAVTQRFWLPVEKQSII